MRAMVKATSYWASLQATAGLTMVELLVVLVIAAILAAIAAPSLQNFVAANQMTAITDSFATALNEARSEAGKLGVPVALTPNDQQNWTNGWTMFVDTNGNGQQDANNPLTPPETTLRTGAKLAAGYTLNSTDSYSGLISFDSSGRLYPPGGQVADFVICQNGSMSAGGGARLISVSTSGQVRVVKPDSSGGLVDDAGKAVAKCTF
jgi:type IV fimbrial biogenesis protein FimT